MTHLVHRRVPVLIVSLSVSELFASVDMLTLVLFVLLEGLLAQLGRQEKES